MGTDSYFFHLINGLSGKIFFLDWLGVFLSEGLPYIAVFFFLFILFREKDWRRKYYFLSFAVLSLILSRGIITETLRYFFPRPRPFVVFEITPLFSEFSNNSFPSGHAAFFFALSFVIYMFLRDLKKTDYAKWGLWFIVGAILIGIGRIYSGVHWPSDIIGGAAIAFISVISARYLLARPYRAGNVFPEAERVQDT